MLYIFNNLIAYMEPLPPSVIVMKIPEPELKFPNLSYIWNILMNAIDFAIYIGLICKIVS